LLSRRSLIGTLLAAPVVITTPGLLMPVCSSLLLPLTERDLRWTYNERDCGFFKGIGAALRLRDGSVHLHAVGFQQDGPLTKAQWQVGRRIVLEHMNAWRAGLPHPKQRYIINA
jgi:hypothetical protein